MRVVKAQEIIVAPAPLERSGAPPPRRSGEIVVSRVTGPALRPPMRHPRMRRGLIIDILV